MFSVSLDVLDSYPETTPTPRDPSTLSEGTWTLHNPNQERLNSPLSPIPYVPLQGPSPGLSTSFGMYRMHLHEPNRAGGEDRTNDHGFRDQVEDLLTGWHRHLVNG